MNKKLLFLPIFVLSLLFVATVSQADVELEDIQAAIRVTQNSDFNSGDIETGAGSPGDYVLTACAVPNPTDSNSFSNPIPGTWTELDQGLCGGDFSCIGGTWGSFVFDSSSTETTCSWDDDGVFVFAGTSMRFSQVDGADPIIDVQCDSGFGSNEALAPSINTEAGSFVVRVYSFRPLEVPNNFDPQTNISFGPDIFAEGFAFNTFQQVVNQMFAEFFPNAGPTGIANLIYDSGGNNSDIEWRACTVGLRMGPPPVFTTNVPTMSEWGLIGFAAFAGIAGVWYLRRRQAIA